MNLSFILKQGGGVLQSCAVDSHFTVDNRGHLCLHFVEDVRVPMLKTRCHCQCEYLACPSSQTSVVTGDSGVGFFLKFRGRHTVLNTA